MPLASAVKLTLHFAASELGADNPDIPDDALANLQLVAEWLEAARGILGVPIVVTSGYRTWAHNGEIGGDPHSDHPNGLAADFEAQGLSPYQVYQQLKAADAAGSLPAFDQLIWYALDNHVHVGLGAGMRRQFLLHTTEGSYVALAGSYLSQLRGFV